MALAMLTRPATLEGTSRSLVGHGCARAKVEDTVTHNHDRLYCPLSRLRRLVILVWYIGSPCAILIFATNHSKHPWRGPARRAALAPHYDRNAARNDSTTTCSITRARPLQLRFELWCRSCEKPLISYSSAVTSRSACLDTRKRATTRACGDLFSSRLGL